MPLLLPRDGLHCQQTAGSVTGRPSKETRGEAGPHLPALEEALLVTVGDVEGQSQDPGRVLHALEEVVQSSPAGSLHHKLALALSQRFGPPHPEFTYKVRLQLVQAEWREVQAAGSQPG